MSDLINRKATINTVINMRKRCGNDINDFYDLLIESFKVLPSAEPKKGRWEERSVCEDEIQQWQSARCSVCEKYHTTPYLYYFDNFNYCPNCGAKMEVTK